jgi:hypothetical protein
MNFKLKWLRKAYVYWRPLFLRRYPAYCLVFFNYFLFNKSEFTQKDINEYLKVSCDAIQLCNTNFVWKLDEINFRLKWLWEACAPVTILPVLISLMLLNLQNAFGQNDTLKSIPKRTIQLTRTTENITPDGALSEKIWQTLPEGDNFTQVNPDEGKPATAKTVFKIVCNDKAIYVAVIMYTDNPGQLRITALTRDFTYQNNDFVSIDIDGFHDKRNAMVFGCNPAGAQWDELSFDDQLYDLNWDGLWRVGTKVFSNRWVAEFEIPWKTLRYKSPGQTQAWGLNIFRISRANNESSAWSPFPHAYNPTRMDFAGELDSINPPPLPANIQVTPYALFNHTNTNSANVYQRPFEYGGDLKYSITPNTVLDLTYKPDFAQAEADLEVNNTTRYSVYYPERRPFFLENASFFGPGLNVNGGGFGGDMEIQAFNSRTIGLDTSGIPITIQGAARLVHRSSTDNFGFIFAHQGDNDLNTSWLGTMRYSYNLGSESRVGLLTNIDDHLLPGGDDLNLVNGADAFVRVNKAESLSGMLMHSYDSKSGQTGYSGYVQYLYINDRVDAYLTGSYIGTHFDNQMGFVSQGNTYSIAPGYIRVIRKVDWLPFHDELLDFDPGMMDEFDYAAGNRQLTHDKVTFYPFYFTLKSGGSFYLLLGNFYDHLFSPFQPLNITIPPGKYYYNNGVLSYTTDPSRKLALSGSVSVGSYFNGWLNNYSGTATYVPIPNISVTGAVTDNDFWSVGNTRHSNVTLLSLNGSFALNTKVILSTLIQANSADYSVGYNFRLAWEYRPLSYLYIVFNKLKPENNLSQVTAYDQEVVKVSYLYQF